MGSLTDTVITTYRNRYGELPEITALAPGRVNLIGEHTDYTGGFVLPVAIDREVVISCGRIPGNRITGYSLEFDREVTITTSDYNPAHPSGWMRYVMGVLSELQKTGREIEGFRFTVGGNVPIGSGLSSSAAIEMAVCTAMEGLLGFRMDDMSAALLCQRAENIFVGMNCGIMDQYISRIGKTGHAILIDCTDLSTRAIPINLPGWTWLVIDSKKRRGLVDSEYNKRRQECEAGVRTAQTVFSDRSVEGLRDIAPGDLDTLRASCDPVVYRRVKHIVSENDRVLRTVGALERGDAEAVGVYLNGSHISLRDDFQVSCAELDLLVDILSGVQGVAGARLTGAGFGGCIICLAREDAVEAINFAIGEKYHPVSLPEDTCADIWPVRVSDGAHLVS
jgi:galactokinase